MLTVDIISKGKSNCIYPNPCRGKLVVSVNDSEQPFDCIITNLNGTVVYKDRITSNRQVLDLSALSKGVYFISLNLKNKTETNKIILI